MQNYQEILRKTGFTGKEATVYEILLELGQTGIGNILKKTTYKRGDIYNILYDLRDKGVVEQTIKNGRINFKPNDPYKIVDYMNKQKETLKQASSLLDAVLPQMFSDYDMTTNKPAIHIFEGNEGIQKVYDMANNSGEKENLLMRSIYDNDDPEEQALIDKQKAKEVELGIWTRLLSPLTEKTRKRIEHDDKVFLVERRIMPKTRFALPAQIRIWGNTVAIISMKKNKIITVIENKDISQTFRIIFELVWDSAKDYHDNLVKKWN